MATSCDSCKLYQDLACLALYSDQAVCRISSCSSPLVELVVKDIAVTLDMSEKLFPHVICHNSTCWLHICQRILLVNKILLEVITTTLYAGLSMPYMQSFTGKLPSQACYSLLSFFIRCLLNASQYHDWDFLMLLDMWQTLAGCKFSIMVIWSFGQIFYYSRYIHCLVLMKLVGSNGSGRNFLFLANSFLSPFFFSLGGCCSFGGLDALHETAYPSPLDFTIYSWAEQNKGFL